MTDQQRTKFAPAYRMQLATVIFRCMDKEWGQSNNPLMADARYLAMQYMRTETDAAVKSSVQAGAQP